MQQRVAFSSLKNSSEYATCRRDGWFANNKMNKNFVVARYATLNGVA